MGKGIPYGRQWIDQEDISAVIEALQGDWLTQGPGVERFESALAEYCGARYAIAVSNGTVALHLACLAAGIGPGDAGITSPITFVASANCLLYVGARPVFADILDLTWNLSPTLTEKRLTEKTKVIIPVDLAGLPCDLDSFRTIADKNNLMIIEDACHALGATYEGNRTGGSGLADMTCLSFHPVKHITTGEGGAILTDDASLANRLRTLRHHGITTDPACMEQNDGPWYYEMLEVGYNGRITDFQCALGASQLKKQERFISRRREIAESYRKGLEHVEGISFQYEPPGRQNVYHLFVVHMEPSKYDRRKVFENMHAGGVCCQVHYVPIHLQPVYRRLLGHEEGDLPVAERYYRGCLSLPIYPKMTASEIQTVIECFTSSLEAGAAS
jgi:UDP-4-amino-4,6-dideoxy-N-acetyl-beta-L-altrosamine transaminase